MGNRVNRAATRGAWGGILLLLLALPAAAETWLDVADDRWVPSIGVMGGATFQEQEAALSSSCEEGGPQDVDGTQPTCNFYFFRRTGFTGPETLRPPEDDSDWAVAPFVAMNLQVMTPVIPKVPLRPRVFLSGELIAFFGPDRNIASERDPSGDIRPPSGRVPDRVPAIGWQGAGSRTRSEIRTGGYGANFGFAFPFQIRGRPLIVKPSAGWMQFTYDVEGKVQAALKNDDVRPRTGIARQATLTGSESITANAVGPAIELELDTGRYGALGSSVFMYGAGYKVLGDTDVAIEETRTITAPTDPDDQLPTDTYHARWSWEMDPWVYRIGVGFRIHLLPR